MLSIQRCLHLTAWVDPLFLKKPSVELWRRSKFPERDQTHQTLPEHQLHLRVGSRPPQRLPVQNCSGAFCLRKYICFPKCWIGFLHQICIWTFICPMSCRDNTDSKSMLSTSLTPWCGPHGTDLITSHFGIRGRMHADTMK